MININDLRVTKKGRTICHVPDLEIAPGERIAVLGPNGSGKTTLLRVLSGLDRTYDGICRVDVPWKERVYIHQTPYMFRGTVLFNVTYGLRQQGKGLAECDRLALHWLDRLGLRHAAHDRTSHLSGGERRRVALARGMVLQPRLLLLDEPFADLDNEGTAAVFSAIEELQDTTVLIASPLTVPNGLTSNVYRLPSLASG